MKDLDSPELPRREDWLRRRCHALIAAIAREHDGGRPVPFPWIFELNDLALEVAAPDPRYAERSDRDNYLHPPGED